ncbi:MAG: tyrosine-type recombinase/integrase, partial [Methylotenera sp.]|nr:tyrosine-type recombinase/integrase [Methylotenera sp.]
IGDIRTYSIGEARTKSTEYMTMTDQGIDPRQVKLDKDEAIKAKQLQLKLDNEAKQLSDARENITLGKVWLIYIEARRKKWSEWSIRDHENIARVGGEKKLRGKGLTEDAPLAALLNVRLIDLTSESIAQWLAIETETRATRAALALRLLSGFLNWCNAQAEYVGLVPSGVCKAQQVRDELSSNNAKEGDCLQREQLGLWFKSVIALSNLVQSNYLQALLLTGARRRELAALRWVDVDFQWLSMTIRDKVEGERVIPLTPYVSNLLQALPRRNEWVFSSATSSNGHIEEPRQAHKRALLAAGLPALTIHGLRRSFGSLAEWTETPAGVVAQIMGHKPSAIAEKHYRRRPLDLLRSWHIKIEAWVLDQAGVKFEPVKAGLKVVA